MTQLTSKFKMAVISAFISFLAHTGDMGTSRPTWAEHPYAPNVFTVNLGPTWTTVNNTQSIEIAPNIYNTYVAPSQSDTLFSGEVFIGWQDALEHLPALYQIGFAYLGTTSTTIHGTVWQLGLPQFDNQTYQYKLNHNHIAFKAKLLQEEAAHIVQAYASISLGVAFNDAHAFTNTPIIDTVLPSANFSNQTETSFTYNVSVGLQKIYMIIAILAWNTRSLTGVKVNLDPHQAKSPVKV